MPSKYNRFLLSACLPVMILGVLSPAHAGFEWTAPEKKTTTPAPAEEKTYEAFRVIEGFGTDMPLALALRQIVPAKYAFSFDESVNLGAIISWTGGKAWNLVLEDALAPLNITYNVNGNKLKLSKIGDNITKTTIIEDIFIEEDDFIITPIIDENDNLPAEKKN